MKHLNQFFQEIKSSSHKRFSAKFILRLAVYLLRLLTHIEQGRFLEVSFSV